MDRSFPPCSQFDNLRKIKKSAEPCSCRLAELVKKRTCSFSRVFMLNDGKSECIIIFSNKKEQAHLRSLDGLATSSNLRFSFTAACSRTGAFYHERTTLDNNASSCGVVAKCTC